MTDGLTKSGFYTEEELTKIGFGAVGFNVLISKQTTLIKPSNMYFGNNIRIDDYVSIICSGDADFRVGNFVHIAAYSYLGCSGGVTIGSYSGLSQAVKIYSASDDYSGAFLTNPTIPSEFRNIDLAPVELRDHVIIGSGSTIFPGTTLEEGVALGAMSLGRGELKSWSIYFGIPAKRIKNRSKELLNYVDLLANKED